MTSRPANHSLAGLLDRYFAAFPDVRFGQALVNLRIVQIRYHAVGGQEVQDPFYEESEETLARATKMFRVLVP